MHCVTTKKTNGLTVMVAVGTAIVLSIFVVYLYSQFKISTSVFMLHIEPIYILFLLFALLMTGVGRRYDKVSVCVLYSVFFVTFICSNAGPDYENYRLIYDMIADGASYGEVHGEILYYVINKIASYIMEYDTFRILYLGLFFALFMYGVYKLSSKPTITFYMTYCGLIVYLVSAYRQFATIAILFYAVYAVKQHKKVRAILLTALSIFIHSAGIVCLLIVMYLVLGRNKSNFIYKNSFSIFIVAVIIRVIATIILMIPGVNGIVARLIAYPEVEFLTFGTISRLFELAGLLFMYRHSTQNTFTSKLFAIYFILSVLYIVIPLEFLMARLTIACRFLAILLISMLSYKEKNYVIDDKRYVSYKATYKLARSMFICFYTVLFIYQMLFQAGYAQYNNFLFK